MHTVPAWFLFLLMLPFMACQSQGPKHPEKNTLTYIEQIEYQRLQKDSTFLKPEQSPLPTLTAIDTFDGLNYFPVDSQYRVQAAFTPVKGAEPFKMAATGEQKDIYLKYGKLNFEINGQPETLSVYQNLRLRDDENYDDYLFLPFRDATNGKSTYGGGRYIDFKIPGSDTVALDFNKAYNPWCVYSFEYSCPIPPEENHLEVAIRAGEKDY